MDNKTFYVQPVGHHLLTIAHPSSFDPYPTGKSGATSNHSIGPENIGLQSVGSGDQITRIDSPQCYRHAVWPRRHPAQRRRRLQATDIVLQVRGLAAASFPASQFEHASRRSDRWRHDFWARQRCQRHHGHRSRDDQWHGLFDECFRRVHCRGVPLAESDQTVNNTFRWAAACCRSRSHGRGLHVQHGQCLSDAATGGFVGGVAQTESDITDTTKPTIEAGAVLFAGRAVRITGDTQIAQTTTRPPTALAWAAMQRLDDGE